MLAVWSDVDARKLHLFKYRDSFKWTKPIASRSAPHVDGVAIDWVHGLLFRTDFDLISILVTDLRALRERALVSTDMEAPRAIVVDPSCGVIFWTDWGAHRIERAGMDGQDRVATLHAKISVRYASSQLRLWAIASAQRVYMPHGLTLDLGARRVYWVEANPETSAPIKGIYSSDYWGNDVRRISRSVAIKNPFSIAIHGDRLYWTDFQRHQVLMASKDGDRVSTVVNIPLPTNVRGPWTIRVFHPDAQPDSENVCSKNKCEQLCLPTSRLGAVKGQNPASNGRLFSCVDGAPANASQPTATRQPGVQAAGGQTRQANQTRSETAPEAAQPPIGQQADSASIPPLLIGGYTNGINLYNQSASTERVFKLTRDSGGIPHAAAIDYWLKEKVVVWSDVNAHTLHLCKYDGVFAWKATAHVVAPRVEGVAVDWVHGLLFRTDFDLMRIIVADLRAKRELRERVLVTTDLEAPRAIAVDPSCGVIFWTDWGAHRIERAGMDGQDRAVIASAEQVHWPNGLTLDLPARRVYWVEANPETSAPMKGIYSSDYWGNDIRTITRSVTIFNPFSIAVHGDRLYWTETQRHQVLTVSKNGGHVAVVVNVPLPTDMRGPWGLRVFHPDAQPDSKNVCANTDCKQLCLPTSRIGISKELEPRDGPFYSCLDGAPANFSRPSPALGRVQQAARAKPTKTPPESRESKVGLPAVPFIVVVVCVVVAIVALFVGCYLLRRNKQRRKRMIIELSAPKSTPPHPTASARDKWLVPASELTITIECQIGSGAFANVYKGRHGTAIVAVKVPREHSAEARRDLDREIEFMKALGTHSHILKLHGYSELDVNRSVLLLEYCASGDLSHWLLAHPKCLDSDDNISRCENHATSRDMCMQLLSFSWQIADGMAYLASRKLIHRDIAARNILLTDEMAAKISDFGMCRRSDGNMYSTKFGKLPIKWMAPESLKAGHFSTKSDVWSFGMLLYELFAAGQIPLSHVQPKEQLAALVEGDRPPNPDNCPDEIYALMQRCWRMYPSQRPAITDLMKDLERIIDASAAEFGYVELCASSGDIRPRTKRYALYRKKPRLTDEEEKTAEHL